MRDENLELFSVTYGSMPVVSKRYVIERRFIMKKFKLNKIITCILAVFLNITAISPFAIADSKNEIIYNLADKTMQKFVEEAREVYKTDEYAGYTSSIVDNYIGAVDKPQPASITWNAIDGASSYTLTVSSSENFNSGEVYKYTGITDTFYDVYNLRTNAHYYWKVESNNSEVIGPIEIKTANTVRYINVEKSRNIRDIGGWNGLNQGLVYRGSELNDVSNHGLGINAEGIKILKNDLGIKTDLDLRQPETTGTGNITESPLGSEVNWINIPITGYEANIETDNDPYNLSFMKRFKSAISVFSDINNYPIYLHCWGGADRTGTVAFILEGLSGASEEDLSIDYELTSFSTLGLRHRYNEITDKSSFTYANMIAKIKAFEGDTLQKKFENYAVNLLGLTRGQVSNIQSILSGNGVVYESTADGTGIIDKNVSWTLANLNGHTIKNISYNGKNIDYNFENNTISLRIPTSTGEGQITFDDGKILKFEGIDNGSNEYVDCNVANKKEVTNVGCDSDRLITLNFSKKMNKSTLTNKNITIKDSAGNSIEYTPYSITDTSYSIDPAVLSKLLFETPTNRGQNLPQGDTYTITVSGVQLADFTAIETTSFTFTTDLILPIAYKEGSYIKDVSVEKKIEALNGVSYGGYGALWSLPQNATDRAIFSKIRMDHAVKETTSDGKKIYNTDKPTYMLDLGAEYKIAGIAVSSRAEKDSGVDNDYYTRLTKHGVSKTKTTSMSDVTVCMDLQYYFGAKSATRFFAVDNAPTGRYVYGAPRDDTTEPYMLLSELYVWAYMDDSEYVDCNVAGKENVTNVGRNSDRLITLNFSQKMDTSTLTNKNITIKDSAGNSIEYTPYSITDTSYSIDPAALSKLLFETPANKGQNLPQGDTYTITVDGVNFADSKAAEKTTFTFTTNLVLPIAYKEGNYIEDVTVGKNIRALNGLPYDGEGGSFWTLPQNATDRNTSTKIRMSHVVKETTSDGKKIYDTDKPTYMLDLGAEYKIAGIAVSSRNTEDSGVDNDYYTRLTKHGVSKTKTTSMSDVTVCMDLQYYFGAKSATRFFAVDNAPTGRYVYGAPRDDTTEPYMLLSELYVWAYMDDSVPEMHFVDNSDSTIKVEANGSDGKMLILAWYSEENKMVGFTISQSGTVSSEKNTTFKYKAFLWDSTTELTPLIPAIEY